MPRLDELYAHEKPDVVLVQGDTTSAFCAGLAAFDRRIPVAHVEAGLRSFDRLHPYPEESNRRMLTAVAELHFAPTGHAKKNLLAEGVPLDRVVVTGNTVVDTLLLTLEQTFQGGPENAENGASEMGAKRRQKVLITLHRREAWETPTGTGDSILDGILVGIRSCAEQRPDVEFVYPVHLNPKVREAAQRVLGRTANVTLSDPLAYIPFVKTMAEARAIVTDSGGVQEEAPSLGVPVLVLRRTTERPEAVESGANRLVGTDPKDIEQALLGVLDQPPPPSPPEFPCPNPFGDGRASARIVQSLLHFSGRAEAPQEFS
jgi:UDP-N-acetylglucosamine 2-epimerase (non-hydrolysing)